MVGVRYVREMPEGHRAAIGGNGRRGCRIEQPVAGRELRQQPLGRIKARCNQHPHRHAGKSGHFEYVVQVAPIATVRCVAKGLALLLGGVGNRNKATRKNNRFNLRQPFNVIPRLVRGTFRRTGVDQVARTSRAMTVKAVLRRFAYGWASPKIPMYPRREPRDSLVGQQAAMELFRQDMQPRGVWVTPVMVRRIAVTDRFYHDFDIEPGEHAGRTACVRRVARAGQTDADRQSGACANRRTAPMSRQSVAEQHRPRSCQRIPWLPAGRTRRAAGGTHVRARLYAYLPICVTWRTAARRAKTSAIRGRRIG